MFQGAQHAKGQAAGASGRLREAREGRRAEPDHGIQQIQCPIYCSHAVITRLWQVIRHLVSRRCWLPLGSPERCNDPGSIHNGGMALFDAS